MTHTVLISGGLGYLGGRLATRISKESYFQVILGTQKKEKALPKWLDKGEIIHLDLLSNESKIISACQNIHSIIHLASLNEIECLSSPEQALIVNCLGTLKLLKAAEITGVKRFIYFSTAHIYGSPLKGKITEETLPKPVHPYAITHRTAEDYVLAANNNKILSGIVLRLSNAVGNPVSKNISRWTLASNDLCHQAVISKKIVLRSSGEEMRDFIAIEDIERAVLHFLDLPTTNCMDGLFNLGGEYSLKIIELADLIASRSTNVLGYKPEIIIKRTSTENKTVEPLNYCIEKLKSTNFNLNKNLINEIDNTLNFCLNSFQIKQYKFL